MAAASNDLKGLGNLWNPEMGELISMICNQFMHSSIEEVANSEHLISKESSKVDPDKEKKISADIPKTHIPNGEIVLPSSQKKSHGKVDPDKDSSNISADIIPKTRILNSEPLLLSPQKKSLGAQKKKTRKITASFDDVAYSPNYLPVKTECGNCESSSSSVKGSACKKSTKKNKVKENTSKVFDRSILASAPTRRPKDQTIMDVCNELMKEDENPYVPTAEGVAIMELTRKEWLAIKEEASRKRR